MTTVTLAVVMDPIGGIKIAKDSSFAMLLAAKDRGWHLRYLEQGDLFLRDGRAFGRWRPLEVRRDEQDWFSLGEAEEGPLADLDVILMRKDPPFDMEYIYATYILELAQREGALVVNDPRSVRDANEKLYTAWFPQCCAPTLVSRDMARLKAFVTEVGDAVVKPLDMMGGASIFRLTPADPNLNVVLESMTEQGRRTIMAQRFVPEISAGDKRILLIDGEPVPYALARIPKEGETRGNLAAGGRAEGRPLSERDEWICRQLGPELKRRGLIFVGLDVIGDYLTEINVTSPTGIQELNRAFDLDIAGLLMDAIERRLRAA